jgi:hypothetical protein
MSAASQARVIPEVSLPVVSAASHVARAQKKTTTKYLKTTTKYQAQSIS